MQVYTWNMQGASSAGDNRWTTSVRALLKKSGGAYNSVFVLQECGSPPSTMKATKRIRWAVGAAPSPLAALNATCINGTWGTATNNVNIFHCAWDVDGNRCNLAIVTRMRPMSYVYLNNQLSWGERPLIGARVGNALICTIHAFAKTKGNDGPRFVAAMPELMRKAGARKWMLAGDFNRDPARYSPPLARRPVGKVHRPSAVTHPGTGTEIDYAIASEAPTPGGTLVLSTPNSDHLPVQFSMTD